MITHDELQEQINEALAALQTNTYDKAELGAQGVLDHVSAAASTSLTQEHVHNFRAQALRILGMAAMGRKDYGKALTLLNDALECCSLFFEDKLVAWITANVGLVHLYNDDTDQALDWINNAYRRAAQIGDKRLMAVNNTNLGLLYNKLFDYTRALEFHIGALVHYEELGDKLNIVKLLEAIASDYFYLADFAKSLDIIAKVLSLHEEDHNRAGMIFCLHFIGAVYVALEDYTLAFEYLHKALALQEESGQIGIVALILGSLGSAYLATMEYEKALEYSSRALAIEEDSGNVVNVAGWLGNIGNIYRQLSNYAKALECYERAIAVFAEHSYQRGMALNYDNLGTLYSLTDFEGYDPSKAEEFFFRAIAINESAGLKKSLSVNLKGMSDLYLNMGRKAEAFDHFVRYHELRNQIQSEEAKKLSQKLEHQRQEAEQEKHLAVERERARATTEVLHKVLPQSIAARLIGGETEIADYFTSVSILFADIAGFTPISADMPAFMVVRFLNFVFSEFDRIIRKHGCEKIKTIGDGYMAVAGAPLACDDHAERITAAALEMQQPIYLPEEIREYLPEGTKFGVRIGLHTGSVVAGVIGDERFVYDIYSDAVNIAARMESHGEANKIHVSQDFVRHLQNRFSSTKNSTHGLGFEKRGEIEIKGKGLMRTYFLEKDNSR